MKIAKLMMVVLLVVSTIPAYAQSASQIKRLAGTGARILGGTARIATDICKIDQGLIASYKERARTSYAADINFERNWSIGWNDQQNVVDNIMTLKTNNPGEYRLQKTELCAAISDEMQP